jgi:hypothetical protein
MACMGRRSLPLRNRSALCAISSGTRGPWNFANTQSMQCLYLERSCSYLYRSCALEIAAKTVFYLQTLTSRFRKSGWRADLLPQLNKINGCSKFSGSKSPAETPANPRKCYTSPRTPFKVPQELVFVIDGSPYQDLRDIIDSFIAQTQPNGEPGTHTGVTGATGAGAA